MKDNLKNVIKFDEKNGFDISKTKKCLKHYKKETKNNALALRYTYDYIDSCYKDKRCNNDISEKDKLKATNELLYRFDELNKKHKFFYSIISSVAISFIISLLLVLLQIPNKSGLTFFEDFLSFAENLFVFLSNTNIFVSIISIPATILCLCIGLLIPFCIVIITFVFSDFLYYSTYRNLVVPYERKIILETLQTFDDRFKNLD